MKPGARAAFSRSRKLLSALGVFAAVVLAVNANVLVSRWYERWDVTSEALYSLSPATAGALSSLSAPVSIVVLLSRADPLLPGVRQMLTAYAAETSKLEIRYVDPERSPAEFTAIQQKYQISTGKAEDGRVVTDAVIIVAQNERSWFITSDDLSSFDDEGRARPRLEQALTEGIANVQRRERALSCFSEGHRETSIDEVGAEGMARLRQTLEKNNFDVKGVNAEQPDSEQALRGCRALWIVGPEVPFSEPAAERVTSYVRGGGGLLLFASPLFAQGGKTTSSGLEPVARLAGVELENRLVLELDSAARLPRGAGEIFFAVPRAHEVTRGLVRDVKVDFRVLVSEAQSLKLDDAGPAKTLLVSSEKSLSIDDVSPLLDGKAPPAAAAPAEYVLAVAAELPKAADSKNAHGPRLVIAGAGNIAWNRSFADDAALLGDRLFVENALAWVAARPLLVSVPEKTAHEVGLALTQDSLGEVLRYVLVYMPAVATLLGVLVMIERRKREKRGRKAAQASAAEVERPE